MSTYALITGASGGIGLALAEALAAEGRNLILIARQQAVLAKLAAELNKRFGVEVLYRKCDLANEKQRLKLLKDLEESGQKIDLLINNAGLGNSGAYINQEWSQEQHLIDLNISALAHLCHAFGQTMAASGGGQILNVASIAAFQPGPMMSNYFASKAYVLSLSEGLREELAGSGVKVSVLCPGATRTAFFDAAQMSVDKLDGTPLMMSAEEVASIALKGLAANSAIITPGLANKLLSNMPRLLPRALMRKFAAKVNQPVVRKK